MRVKFIALVAMLSLCGLTTNASAAIVNVTYAGVVTDDSDLSGEFGVADGLNNLVDDDYIANFVFNTAFGSALNVQAEHYVGGGSAYGTSSPSISASVTINGHTEEVSGTLIGYILGFQNNGFGEILHAAENSVVNYYYYRYQYSYNEIYGFDASIPSNIDGPFTFFTSDKDYGNKATYYDYLVAQESGYIEANTTVDASITSVAVSSSVPEPSSWALMLLGFTGIGLVAYCKVKIDRASQHSLVERFKSV